MGDLRQLNPAPGLFTGNINIRIHRGVLTFFLKVDQAIYCIQPSMINNIQGLQLLHLQRMQTINPVKFNPQDQQMWPTFLQKP